MAEAIRAVVAAVTLSFTGQPYSEIAMEDELEFRMLAPAVRGRGWVGLLFVRLSNTPSRCQTSRRSALRARGSWNGHIVCMVPSASNGFRLVTGMCRAKTRCSGCSGLRYSRRVFLTELRHN